MRRVLTAVVAALVVVGMAPATASADAPSYNPQCQNGKVRSGGAELSVPINFGTIFAKPFNVCLIKWTVNADASDDIVLLPGFAHDADFYEKLALSLKAAYPNLIHNIYAVDLPGHGDSGWSSYDIFETYGMMRQDDQTRAVKQVMTWLKSSQAETKGAVEVVAGHSMGGQIWQDVQAELTGSGTNMRQAYGTNAAIMLASIFPENVHWNYPDDRPLDVFLDLLPNLCPGSPHCAQPLIPSAFLYTEASTSAFRKLFLTPPVETVTDDAIKKVSCQEPFFVGTDALGLGNGTRVSVPEGAFGNGNIWLGGVAYENDHFFADQGSDKYWEEKTLFDHLKGGNAQFTKVSGVPHDAPMLTAKLQETAAVFNTALIQT